MTDGNKRKKAQAVFFSLVMVLSMVGGSVALAGSAAAAAPGGGSLSDTYVQSDATVTIEGIDANTDGNSLEVIALNQSGDQVGSTPISDSDVKETESWSTEFAVSDLDLSDGDFEIYINDTEDGVDSSVGTLTVDDDEPMVTPTSPVNNDVVNSQTETINLDISDVDGDTANSDLSISVNIDNNGNINTYQISPGSDTADGVDYDTSTGELTITPGTEVPELQEGTVSVEVSATDRADNTNTSTYSFEVDQNGPTSQFDTPELTNDVNETVSVSLISGGEQINDSTVSLDINGPTSASFDYEDDEYDNSSDEFTVTPGSSDVPSLDDGEYSVEVSATDEAGNTHTQEYDFEVDTSQIAADPVTVDGTPVNSESDDPTVTVTFGEPVNFSTVSADVVFDGSSQETLTFTEKNDTAAEADLDLTDTAYDNVENDSVVVNVTSAQDLAGNTLANPADSRSQSHEFEIDTDGPSVTLGELPNDGTLSGYVNVSSFISSTTDVDETTVEIEVGGNDAVVDNEDAVVDITPVADNVTTQNLPDGDHALQVTVKDDAGNSETATAAFTLDNDQPVTVEQPYLSGIVTPVDQGTSDVTVSEIFNNELDPEDVTYTVDDVERDADYTIEAQENRGQTLFVNASVGGNTIPVQIEFAPLVGAESVSGDSINIGLDTSDGEDIHDLTITVEDTDSHFAETERTIPSDNFAEYSESGIYTETVDGLDDGFYTVTVTNADGEDVTDDVIDGDGNVGTEATVDDRDPSAETAYVANSNGDATLVHVEFSEAVNDVAAEDVSFDGSSDAVLEVENNDDDTLDVILEGEVQTADAPLLNVSGVTETNGDGSTTAEASTEVATASFDLSSDQLNVVSIPAESGRVDISETAFNSHAINTVSAYDADTGEWEQFSPGAEDNDLTTLKGGVGYVVNAEEDTTVEINAENAPVANDRTQQSVDAGWNLIGHYQEGQQQVGQALTPLGDQVYQIEEGYTGSQLTNDAALDPGQGYWLFTNDGGLHVPVNYGGPTSEKPDVFVPSGESFVDTTEPTNDGEVTITVAVDTDAAVQTVRADARDLGIEGAELSSVGAPEVQGATAYTGTFDVDYQAGYDGINDETITVSAITADGNVGSYSETVDPVDRSGSVTITDADFSDLTEGDTANVTVETEYDDGTDDGFEDAVLSVENSSGVELKRTSAPETNGSTDVNVELSSLDEGEDITVELIDAGEASDYVVADGSDQVSGLTQIAYIENSPSTVLGTGPTAIQDAVDDEQSTGVTVYVEQGTYDSVSIDKSITVIGSGNGTAENGGTVISGSTGSAGGAIDVQSGTSDVMVESVHATDNGESASAAFMVRGDVTNLEVSDSTLVGESKSALLMEGGQTDHTIQDNTIEVESDGQTAVTLAYVNGDQSVGKTSTGVDFVDNTFTGDVSGGIGLGVESENSEIRQNTFSVESTYGQVEVWDTGATVEDNTFETVSSGSFYFNDGNGNYDESTIDSDNTFPDSAVVTTDDDQIVEPSQLT